MKVILCTGMGSCIQCPGSPNIPNTGYVSEKNTVCPTRYRTWHLFNNVMPRLGLNTCGPK